MKRSIADQLIEAAQELRTAADGLAFDLPVAHVYNPLVYAWEPHQEYLRRYGNNPKRVLFLGMNPGPFGMAQTGIPFGEIAAVRDWLKIQRPVANPARQHSKRPILGFACPRSEVSGRRLWGLFARRFGKPERFFAEHFVVNYCPLVFVEATGCNRTPDKLPNSERLQLLAICDRHLRRVIEILSVEWLIGVGRFAAERGLALGGDRPIRIGTILHPSPASPASNKDWEGTVTKQLNGLGVWA